MKVLLPNSYKKLGMILAPVGFLIWLAMQRGFINRLLKWVFGNPDTTSMQSAFHTVNVLVAILSFFSFLAGLYFLAFSKEKVEDEMIQRVRLDSFQFAALVQILFIILGFIVVLIFRDPGPEGLMLFFILGLFSFWLSFIARFHYVLHIRFRSI